MRVIPKHFDLLGHTIAVVIRDDLQEDAGCYGRWWQTKQMIELQSTKHGNVTPSFQMQTFWHEVTHAILDNIGSEDLSSDEKFVDLFGQCIHQILKTKRSK